MLPIIACLLSSLAFAGPAGDAASVVRKIEARYRHASTLKAKFYEQYFDGKGGAAESGTVYFSKPGRMRWEYESPEPKLFIVDGTNVWFYVPADRTVSRAKIGQSSDWRTPLAFLTGKTNLTRLCSSITIADPRLDSDPEEKPASPGDTVLRCVPRATSSDAGEQIRDALLEADSEGHLVRVVIQQPGNLMTEFRFGDWEENLPLAETKFHFFPPEGVAVVDEATIADSLR